MKKILMTRIMSMDSTEDHFSQLPIELKTMIFDKLGIVDIRNSRRVCKEWMQILNDYVRMRVRLTNDSVAYVKNCSAMKVDCLNVKNFWEKVTLSTARKTTIPEAKTIVIDTGNSSENLMNIWRYSFKGVKTLHLHNGSLAQFSAASMAAVIPYVNWETLVELHVRMITEAAVRSHGMWCTGTSRCHLIALIEFFKGLNAPCLKDVRIHAEARIIDTNSIPLLKFIAKLLPFLVRHKNTLVALNIFARGRFYFQKLKGFKVSGLELMNLETLSLDFDAEHSQMCMNLSVAGNNLKTLMLRKDYWTSRDYLNIPVSFKSVIQRNRKTLETITIKRMDLDCSWFDGCEALKSLELLIWNPRNLKSCGTVLPALRELFIDGYIVKNWTTPCDEEPETLRDQILDWIRNCMINLEILSLEFNFDLKFTVQHYESLMRRLPKLRMLSLTRIEAEAFQNLERENPRDSMIFLSVILVVPQETQTPFHIFQMNKRITNGHKWSNLDKFRV